MRSGSLPHKLIVILLSLILILGLSAPLNNVDARHHHVRHYRRVRIHRHRHYRRRRSQRRRRYHHFKRRARRRHRRRVIVRHHYTKPYPTVNDRIKWVSHRLKWSQHPKQRKETIKSVYGPRVTFKTLYFIPSSLADHNFLVQSLNVIPNGHYAFVGYGHDPSLKRGRDLTRIAKVDLRHRRFKISKAFDGGHGQAMAYNPVSHSLWILNDVGGSIHKGSLERISTNSLKPKHRVHFRLKSGDDLGDSLAFDNHGRAYNENLIWPSTAFRGFRSGMIVLYRGFVNDQHARFSIVSQGLRHSPSDVIQGIAYNPRTKRLYFESNDAIVSVPANRLGHLRPRDVKETVLRQRREYEGISFDRQGHAYILLNNPKEIMKSTGVF